MKQARFIYGIPALSVYIGKSERSIQRWLSTGKLTASKVGGHWAFDKAVIDKWMKEVGEYGKGNSADNS